MRSNVKAPALVRQRNGLLQVGNLVQPGDSRWEDGISFTPHGCPVIFGHDTKCWYPRGDKLIQDCPPVAEFYPYVLELTQAWSTLDLGAGPKELAQEAFDYGTSAVLARLMEMPIADWPDADEITIPALGGRINVGAIRGRAVPLFQPHLYDPAPTGGGQLINGTAVPANEAIGTVEAKLLDASDHTGSAGTIYMNPQVAALGWGALCVEGPNEIYTLATGCRVIIDNYGGAVVYGHTGEVDIYLGDVENVEVTEAASNTYIVQAERIAAAVWNTCAVYYTPVLTSNITSMQEVFIGAEDPTSIPSTELWYDSDQERAILGPSGPTGPTGP